jgi:hypothetical protein
MLAISTPPLAVVRGAWAVVRWSAEPGWGAWCVVPSAWYSVRGTWGWMDGWVGRCARACVCFHCAGRGGGIGDIWERLLAYLFYLPACFDYLAAAPACSSLLPVPCRDTLTLAFLALVLQLQLQPQQHHVMAPLGTAVPRIHQNQQQGPQRPHGTRHRALRRRAHPLCTRSAHLPVCGYTPAVRVPAGRLLRELCRVVGEEQGAVWEGGDGVFWGG